jgi:cytochrome c5
MTRYRSVRTLFYSMLGLALIACARKESPQEQHARALAHAATAAPSDERLAMLYKQSCKACHSIENSGAPLVGDHSQWDTRWNKGVPVLLQNVVAGFNGMPASGQCFACTAADFEALIAFLAGRDKN